MEFRYGLPERRLRICTPLTAARAPRVFAADELFRFGIEEEYFLSDSETFAAPAETPDAARTVASPAERRIGRRRTWPYDPSLWNTSARALARFGAKPKRSLLADHG